MRGQWRVQAGSATEAKYRGQWIHRGQLRLRVGPVRIRTQDRVGPGRRELCEDRPGRQVLLPEERSVQLEGKRIPQVLLQLYTGNRNTPIIK